MNCARCRTTFPLIFLQIFIILEHYTGPWRLLFCPFLCAAGAEGEDHQIVTMAELRMFAAVQAEIMREHDAKFRELECFMHHKPSKKRAYN